jgi:hypothetical protein
VIRQLLVPRTYQFRPPPYVEPLPYRRATQEDDRAEVDALSWHLPAVPFTTTLPLTEAWLLIGGGPLIGAWGLGTCL